MKHITLIIATLIATSVFADPCGMVPPIYTGPGVPITRIGEQLTYVFHKDGIESFVIRPGFQGKIDEFGMLIPFPTPPAIRKVPDHIFPHIAAAVDPPEVVINLMVRRMMLRSAMVADGPASASEGLAIKKNEVRVLREEAVGMYEVAVLEAGSAGALKKWMDKNGYRFPDGMETPCNEYVADGWCFVAVKTQVGPKAGVDPQPGQRSVDSKMAAGSSFDGFVQAMGFRFKSEELVVPMRLSTFNGDDTRNIVYLLTEGPRKIRAIPEEFVRRQINGAELVGNLTNPLPLRIIGGELNDIMLKDQAAGVRRIMPQYGHNLKERRDPRNKSGAARELFAADLMAVESGQLALEHEETEKTLLKIGERLGLRGAEIDKLNAEQMTAELAETVADASDLMKKMTLTVVDGDFPRDVLAKQNLTFGDFTMAAASNNSSNYNAIQKGPQPKQKNRGKSTLIRESVSELTIPLRWYERGLSHLLGRVTLFCAGLGCFFVLTGGRSWTRKSSDSVDTSRSVATPATPKLVSRKLLGLLAVIGTALATAGIDSPVHADEAAAAQIEIATALANPERAEAIVDMLSAGNEAPKAVRDGYVKELARIAQTHEDTAARGWAITALGEIGGMDVDEALLKIQANAENSQLVRTWAAASRVTMCKSTESLIEKSQLIREFPALGRPIGKRIVDQMENDGDITAEQLLQASMKVPQIAGALGPAIMAQGADKLIGAMTGAKDQQVRRRAAAYLGSLSQQDRDHVSQATLATFEFQRDAADVPWSGGPLFIPGMDWKKEDAGSLVRSLMAWFVWAEEKGDTDLQRQIHNNIRSVGLSRKVGYSAPNFQFASAPEWLTSWGQKAGREQVAALLAEQGLENNPKYTKVLGELNSPR